MHSSTGYPPRFSGPAMVCTALRDHAGNGLVHLLVSNTTATEFLEFRYELRAASGAQKAAGPERPPRR